MEGHFLSLEPEARRLRFGDSCRGEALIEYVRTLDFDRAHVRFIAANHRMAAIPDHYDAVREQDGTERMVHVPLPATLSRPLQAPIGPFVPVWFD